MFTITNLALYASIIGAAPRQVNETPGSLTGMLKLNMKAEGGMIFGEGFVQLSAFIFHLF